LGILLWTGIWNWTGDFIVDSLLKMGCGLYCVQLTGTGMSISFWTHEWNWTTFILQAANWKWTEGFIVES